MTEEIAPRAANRRCFPRWLARVGAVAGCSLALGVGYAAAAGGIGSFTLFSTGLTPVDTLGGYYAAAGVADGADGNLWFSAVNTNANPLIGRINPDGTVSRFETGHQANGAVTSDSAPSAMTQGPDGNVWFIDMRYGTYEIGRITEAGTLTWFSTGSLRPEGISAGSDGNVWFTSKGHVGKITPAGVITEYALASPYDVSFPDGIAAGPDGDMWFTILNPSAIGRITPDGTISVFTGLSSSAGPTSIAQGADGNMWFVESSGAYLAGLSIQPAIGRITPSGVVTEFPLSTSEQPISIAAGPDGNMWFIDRTDPAAVGRITPNGTISEFTTGAEGLNYLSAIAAGSDGGVWFTAWDGYLVPQLVRIQTGAPAASVAPPVVAGSGQQGDAQSCAGALWSDWAGQQPSTTAYAEDGYQWLLDGNAIDGQTAQTYTPTAADVGHQLSCRLTVTYTLFPATVSATSAAVIVTAAPVTTSSGGGGGGPIPDLALTLDGPSQVAAGAEATFSLAVSDLNGAGASGIHAVVTLPAGAVVDGSSADRGPGCTAGATAGTLDCNLDFLSGSLVAHVTFVLTLPAAGPATVIATVSDAQGDKDSSNNTAARTVQVGSATVTTTPTRAPQPIAKKAGVTVTIVGVQTVQLGKQPVLHVTLKVTKPTKVVLTLLGPNGKTIASWVVRLTAGTKHLTLELPAKARHQGRDTLRVQTANSTTKTVHVSLRG